MMNLHQLYKRASRQGIEIDEIRMRELEAVSFPEGWIAIDPTRFATSTAFKCALAHEIAHCETGSFYNIYSPYDLKSKCEYKANKRAAEMLMPFREVLDALRAGYRTIWALAGYFDVTEEFAEIAMGFYADLLQIAN